MVPHSLYFHIPFCEKRCGYCDFYSTSGHLNKIPAYVAALCDELALLARSSLFPIEVHSIFFGGGTPSLMPTDHIQQVMDTAARCFQIYQDSENTLEANPGTVDREYFKALFNTGINRVSMGMQSAHADDLRLLERIHTHADVIRAVQDARSAGFSNLSLDLIYGLPLQTMERWQYTLHEAVRLKPSHLSLYALTLEQGTSLYRQVQDRRLPEPDDDLAADMYEWATDFLQQRGYAQYEISNWALVDTAGSVASCRHNLQYWRNLPYLGIGASAHGCASGHRMANVSDLDDYIKRIQSTTDHPVYPFSPANIDRIPIDFRTEMQETMMLGLRLVQDGVNKAAFEARFGSLLAVEFGEKIDRLVRAGLLEWSSDDHDILRLTPGGRLIGNLVFREFVGED